MFIKSLVIDGKKGNIRTMDFKSGLNIIIDKTPATENTSTGNNVGKTTILKLVDFCLGANRDIIYKDEENPKENYKLIKDFLIDEEILITLTLKEDLNISTSKEIVISRNFLSYSKKIIIINGKRILDKDFENELLKLLIPNQKSDKPSFVQIISHNIRYKDISINNTLKILDKYSSSVEYETLYLFLLGCDFDSGAKKQALHIKVKEEEVLKSRIEKKQTKTAYEAALAVLEEDIKKIDEKRYNFNLNKNFEQDLQSLNDVKYQINKSSSSISKMKIRKELIEEAQLALTENKSIISLNQLKRLYSEAKINVQGIQKTFEDLVDYHNKMLVEKAYFIAADLPHLKENIQTEEKKLSLLLEQEKKLSEIISKSDSFEELEKFIIESNDKYTRKGEYETLISQLNEFYTNITNLNKEIEDINEYLFSDRFEDKLKIQINKFNKYFSTVSQELYGESYALKYDQKKDKQNRQIYEFSAFNTNMSSGKKQGEIICFDLAYTQFADAENLPCLHFLLNDKKELLHDNQLITAAQIANRTNTQLILSIMKVKLPQAILDISHKVIELSQENKLFKVEE